MTHVLTPISKNQRRAVTSNVYSVLNNMRCFSCHIVRNVAHIRDEAPPADFFFPTTAISIYVEHGGHTDSNTLKLRAAAQWGVGVWRVVTCIGKKSSRDLNKLTSISGSRVTVYAFNKSQCHRSVVGSILFVIQRKSCKCTMVSSVFNAWMILRTKNSLAMAGGYSQRTLLASKLTWTASCLSRWQLSKCVTKEALERILVSIGDLYP